MSIIVIPTRVNQTAAEWALDSTVYPAWKILCVTDQFITGTDQPMIKYADGVQTFAQLDFVPDYLIPLNNHISDNSNPHQVTLEQARLSDNFFEGEVDMNGERLRNLPVPVNADEGVNKAYVDGLVDSTLKAPEAFTPSGSYPTTYNSNPIKKGDSFRVAAGTMGGVTVEGEELLIALINTPGQTDANWQILESNRNQATESLKGIAQITNQATIEDELTSNNQDIVTPQKFWFGILRFLLLPWTWASKQTFTSAPRFNSAGASQYLKTDGSKDLTSSETIPSSDITGTKTNTFISDFNTAALSAVQSELDSKSQGEIIGYPKKTTSRYESWSTSPGATSLSTNSSTHGQNVQRWYPYIVSKTTTFNSIGVKVTAGGTAGSIMRLGIYNSVDNSPTTLIAEGGVAIDSIGFQIYTFPSPVTLQPGLYFLSQNNNAVSPPTCIISAASNSINVLGHSTTNSTSSPITNFTENVAYSNPLPSDVSASTLTIQTGGFLLIYLRATT